jgi:hypothetical protein
LAFRRFDLSGGPREFYEFRIPENLVGKFGAKIPEPCDTTACKTEWPISKMKLVDNPDLLEYKDMTTGLCGEDPDKVKKTLSDKALKIQEDNIRKTFYKVKAD